VLITCVRSDAEVIGLPSIEVIVSPAARPADWAGVLGVTACTAAPAAPVPPPFADAVAISTPSSAAGPMWTVALA
jgi:hypothetical protein